MTKTMIDEYAREMSESEPVGQHEARHTAEGPTDAEILCQCPACGSARASGATPKKVRL